MNSALSKIDRQILWLNRVIVTFLVVITIVPLIYVLVASFMDPATLINKGISFNPKDWTIRRSLNQGQGYSACGWLFDGDTLFDSAALLAWAQQAQVDRIKGVMRTAEGTMRINGEAKALHSETSAVSPPDSRIEVIHSQQADWNRLQSALLHVKHLQS